MTNKEKILDRFAQLVAFCLLAAIVFALTASLFGCAGDLDRRKTALSGYAERCVDGVAYVIFTTGASVKYTPEGKVATCQ